MNFDLWKKIPQLKILVAGEVGIDEYVWGDTRRISPEAPVPVVEVSHQTHHLGLGGNVAQNIATLGARVNLVSVRGDDADGKRLDQMLVEAGIHESLLIADGSRPTLRKTRVIAQKQHVVRIDHERVHPLDVKLAGEFRDYICDHIPSCDGVIVQDYGKGLWNTDTISIVKHAETHARPVFVDPSRFSPVGLYRGVTLLTPNAAEAEILAGISEPSVKNTKPDVERLLNVAKKILIETVAEHIVITCGEWGMVSLSRGQTSLTAIPTFAREVYDVTGAGDTVIAVIALMWILGLTLPDCMVIANAAAGIVVSRIGTSSVTRAELTETLESLEKEGRLPSK